MAQQYSLRWNNHQPNFISMFTTLLNTQTLVDVTLAAEGKHLQAHKVVLSACSTYFQALFVDNPSRHPIVILKDVTFADLRTMVDFMYYGEVNVTEEQLPKVLDTAKLLKIKGLTEMPDSTSLTRAQGGAGGGPAADFHSPAEPADPQRMSSSPASSPSIKRRRRRKSSTGSTSLHVVGEEAREEPAAELARDGGGGGGGVTLSSVPARRRDIFDDRHHDASHQTPDNPHNLNMDTLGVDNPTVMAQAIKKPDVAVGSAETFAAGLKLRRSTHFKRQHRVPEDGGGEGVHRQASEPCAALPPLPALRKYDSYPQYTTKTRRMKSEEHDVGPMLIRTVTVIEQPAPGAGAGGGEAAPRASHTPAVRSGPPLSCNFCWNTVDDCGRILRRKTQYHCPECRTNLCIVPCFHEYHDTEPAAAAHHLRLGPATSHHQ